MQTFPKYVATKLRACGMPWQLAVQENCATKFLLCGTVFTITVICFQAIKLIKYSNKNGRNVGAALASVKRDVLDKGARPGVPQIVVTLMYRKSFDDPILPATTLKATGVKMIVLGIGKGVKPTSLAPWASSLSFVLTQRPFRDLITINAPLVGKINSGKSNGIFVF